MRSLIIIAAISTAFLAACNNSNSKTSTPAATTPAATAAAATPVSAAQPVIHSYLQLKNALAADNSNDAATAGDAIATAFGQFDTTGLTASQRKVYTDIADDARENAEHIGKNGSNIEHQREHFDMLSKEIYLLAKTFSTGEKLYYTHCPMYNNNKGADWLSETADIRNPYFGKAMTTCGAVTEEIK